MARPSLPQRRQRLGAVGTERAPGLRLPPEHDRAALALVLHPVWSATPRLGALWHRPGPRSLSRVRLRAMRHEPTLEAETRDRAGQDRGPTGRAIAVRGPLPGHRVVACARGTQAPKLWRHLVRARPVGAGPARHGARNRRGRAATPDHAGVHLIAPRPLEHPLVDAPPQEGLARCLRQHVGGPECRELLAPGAAGRWPRGGQRVGGRRAGLGALLLSGCGLLERLQRQLPGVCQCGGALPMRRIDVVEWARTIGGRIAPALERLRLGGGKALGRRRPLGQCLCRARALHGREGLDKRVDAPGIDRSGRNLLTHGGPILWSEGVTEGAGAPLLLPHHLVAACPAGDEPVPEGCARAREATGVVPVILGVLVFAPGLHLESRVPTHGGRRDVRETETPLLLGQTGAGGACLGGLASQRAAAALGERPGRGRRRENREPGRHPGCLPDQSAAAGTAGQQPVVGFAPLDDFAGRTTR
jgi:hypothetical protein